jgi:hypothetical protein
MIRRMSKTVPVRFGDQFFWAYDVSFGILILEAIDAAAGMSQPEGAGEVLEQLRAHAQVGASWAFTLDDDRWSPPQRSFVHRIIAEAGRRLRERGTMTRIEAETRYVIGNEPFALRFEEYVEGAVVADVAEAMNRLINADLPPVPHADRNWLYGVQGGPLTT